MRVLVQRSLCSSVSVNEKIVGSINHGLVLFVGFTEGDGMEQIDYLIDKIIHLRIFNDENGRMNLSLLDVSGSILSVSQFTLYADTKKGRRPSYKEALGALESEKLYYQFNERLKECGVHVETGVFQADMNVSIANQGPVTILLESR